MVLGVLCDMVDLFNLCIPGSGDRRGHLGTGESHKISKAPLHYSTTTFVNNISKDSSDDIFQNETFNVMPSPRQRKRYL